MGELEDLVAALGPVAKTLDSLRVRYYVGESVASSYHGAARSTMDVDLVCELLDEHVSQLVKSVGEEFYVSENAARDAVKRRSCFNLIHQPTSFKVGLFVSRERDFDLECMRRATTARFGERQHIDVRVASVEDSIVSKLEWFRLSNETSERQWDDVSRLRDLLGEAADIDYMQKAARSVNVEDLLKRLFGES